jgi:NADPH:quinone reductase-like Zn-dependent oxidoreductase
MEGYHIERFGSVDGVMLRSADDPRPGLREVLMRVRASSLNYRDLIVLRGAGSDQARRDTPLRRHRRSGRASVASDLRSYIFD